MSSRTHANDQEGIKKPPKKLMFGQILGGGSDWELFSSLIYYREQLFRLDFSHMLIWSLLRISDHCPPFNFWFEFIHVLFVIIQTFVLKHFEGNLHKLRFNWAEVICRNVEETLRQAHIDSYMNNFWYKFLRIRINIVFPLLQPLLFYHSIQGWMFMVLMSFEYLMRPEVWLHQMWHKASWFHQIPLFGL